MKKYYRMMKPWHSKNNIYTFVSGIVEVLNGLFKIFTLGHYGLSLDIDYCYWYHLRKLEKERERNET